MLNFQELINDSLVLEALQLKNYVTPTPIQQEVIPVFLKNKDLIVRSNTGTGKTAAYGIPLCTLISIEEKNPKVLVIVPTRELAIQVKDEIKEIGRLKRIKVLSIFGGVPIIDQVNQLKYNPSVLVATPGRLLDLVEQGVLDLSTIEYVVIDEADQLFNMGFLNDVESILQVISKRRITSLFSATFPDQVKKLVSNYLKEPVNIQSIDDNPTPVQIKHAFIQHLNNHRNKIDFIVKLTSSINHKKCIVFCNTQSDVDFVYEELENKVENILKLHGGMTQKERYQAFKQFQTDHAKVLISTDLAARGIDIDSLDVVINYEYPSSYEQYIHRTGRTGRMENLGIAITLLNTSDTKFQQMIQSRIHLENYTNLFNDLVKQINLISSEQSYSKNVKENETPLISAQKVYFSAGRNKKLRNIDFVGSLLNIEGINKEDVGTIEIQNHFTYVDIFNQKEEIIFKFANDDKIKIKGINVKVERANQ